MLKHHLIGLLSLSAWPTLAGEPSPMPPLGPQGETALASPPAQGVERCLTLLRQATDREHAHVDRSLVTSSPRWGPMFRADFSTSTAPTVAARFVCPIDPPGPVVFSFEVDIPPLVSGPWGNVTSYR